MRKAVPSLQITIHSPATFLQAKHNPPLSAQALALGASYSTSVVWYSLGLLDIAGWRGGCSEEQSAVHLPRQRSQCRYKVHNGTSGRHARYFQFSLEVRPTVSREKRMAWIQTKGAALLGTSHGYVLSSIFSSSHYSTWEPETGLGIPQLDRHNLGRNAHRKLNTLTR